MRKQLLFLVCLGSMVLFGCVKQSDIEGLQQQIDELKTSQIATINAQIAGITLSVGNLQSVDTELRNYINTLQDQKETLDQADKDLAKSIADLKEELSGDITDAESGVLAQLETYRQTVSLQLEAINASIKSLQEKDEDLQNQITALQNYINKDLKTYIDNGDNAVKDWVTATFVTLEQYNATAAAVTSIQGQLNLINEQLEQLGGATGGVSKQELDSAISSLDGSLQEKILKAVSDCDSALSTARVEITAAYNDAITKAISASEASMKAWVNEKLTGYYTLAQTDSKLSTLRSSLETQLSAQKTELTGLLSIMESTLKGKIEANASDIEDCQELIEECQRLIGINEKAISDNAAAITQLVKDLEKAKTDITAAYQQAISTAITTLDGKLSGEIAETVETINGRIDTEVASINESLSSLSKRVSTCETDIKNIKNTIYGIQQDIEDIQEQIEAILARIQSITYVPAYSDGKAVMTYTDNGTLTPGTTVLDFKVQPAALAEEIIKVWHTALKAEAVYTITKAAPETVALTITSTNAQSGYLSVTVSGAGLKEDFFRSRCSAYITLMISDGNNECATDYVQMIPWTTDIISFGDPALKAYCVENFDTDGDGELTEEEAQEATTINASMLNITSLVGIEYFSNLESIDVSFNKLETLDLSHSPKLNTVLVNGNKLQSICLSGLTAMTELDCSNNKLTALNLSESEGLLTLVCSGNQIGALNINKNKALANLQCSNNQLTALDLKNNTALKTLYCRKNNIAVLDVIKLSALKELDCSQNKLASLNLFQNSSLDILYCASNQLTSLGLSSNINLTFLDCQGNAITALDLSKNTLLESINCAGNQLVRLDVSSNPALETVICTGNPSLAKLWVRNASHAAAMSIDKDSFTTIAYNDGGIYIPDNNLKAYLLALFDDDEDGQISIIESENIQNVNCSNRGISDITGLEVCPNLKYLNVSGNNVSKIELPGLEKLETIVAYGNPISRLNVNNATSLSALYLQDINTNALSGNAITINAYDQASTLYLALAGTHFTELNLTNSTALVSYDISENYQLTNFVAKNNPQISSVNVSPLLGLSSLDVSNCALTSLNVSDNTNLTQLNCSGNKLLALNIDNNLGLTFLNCSGNQLTTLRVTNNRLIEDINASNNQLLNLNVRQNTALKSLNVGNNTGITAMALGYNTALERLNISNTGLTDIDLSANQILSDINISGCISIVAINVSELSSLLSLNVAGTSLTSLDLLSNTKLKTLDVSNNDNLLSLDFNEGLSVKTDFSTGRTIKVNGVEGITIYASGTSTKIMSIDQTSKSWGYFGTSYGGNYGDKTGATSRVNGYYNSLSKSPAFIWCREKGDRWYLPAIEELVTIYNNKDILNTFLNTKISGVYWSSTEEARVVKTDYGSTTHYCTYYISMSNGSTYLPTNERDVSRSVRAVRVF